MTQQLREKKNRGPTVPMTLEGQIVDVPIMDLSKTERLLYLTELSSIRARTKDIPYIFRRYYTN